MVGGFKLNISANHWNLFIKNLADELTADNVTSIKFMCRDCIAAGTAEKLQDALSLLAALEKYDIFNQHDISNLYDIINGLPRKDLIKKLDGYEAQRIAATEENKSAKEDEEKRPKSTFSASNLYDAAITTPVHKAKSTPDLQHPTPSPKPTLMSPDFFRKNTSSNNNSHEEQLVAQCGHDVVEGVPSRPKVYSMRRIPRGKCIIFNNDFKNKIKLQNGHVLGFRNGTEKDEIMLKETFEWLHFNVDIYSNSTADEMIEVLQYNAEKENHDNFDCFICCILTHGFEGGVYGNDGHEIEISQLKSILEGDKCKSLLEKPKLFFIQACQGGADGRGIGVSADSPMPPQNSLQNQSVKKNTTSELSVNADFLTFMATTPGTISWRDPRTGSWFIQCLCKVLQAQAMECSLNDILLEVNNMIASKVDKTPEGGSAKQMSDFGQNTLRRKLFFYPSSSFNPSVPYTVKKKLPVESPS